jgi:hypothetical protein
MMGKPDLCRALADFCAREHDAQARLLTDLVRVPSDNPPGDCAPHAERAAALLEGLGLSVQRQPVPAELVRANGMVSATNLIVRERFGAGPTVALNAHGDVVPPGEGWSTNPYGAAIPGTAGCMAAAWRSRRATSRPTATRCSRSNRSARRSPARSSCT